MYFIDAIYDKTLSCEQTIEEIKKFLDLGGCYGKIFKDEKSEKYYEVIFPEFKSENAMNEHINTTGGLAVNSSEIGAGNKYTLLGMATESGKFGFIKWLVEEMGANVNLGHAQGTSLTIAIQQNYPLIIDYLISKGANLEATHFGKPALNLAIELGRVEIVKSLLKNGVEFPKNEPLKFAEKIIFNLLSALKNTNQVDEKLSSQLKNMKIILELFKSPSDTHYEALLRYSFHSYSAILRPSDSRTYNERLVEQIGKIVLANTFTVANQERDLKIILVIEKGLYTLGSYFLDLSSGIKATLPNDFYDKIYAQIIFDDLREKKDPSCRGSSVISKEAIEDYYDFNKKLKISRNKKESFKYIKKLIQAYCDRLEICYTGHTLLIQKNKYELLAKALATYNPKKYSKLVNSEESEILKNKFNPLYLRRLSQAVIAALNENKIIDYLNQTVEQIIDISTISHHQSVIQMYRNTKLNALAPPILGAFKNIFEKMEDASFINGITKEGVIKEIEQGSLGTFYKIY